MSIYAKGVKGKCDKLTSKIVRSLGHCQHCGGNNFLQCAHVISRKYSATRCHLPNLLCLCAACHRRFTDFPREFSHFITEHIGSEKYEELRLKAETVTKMDWGEVYDELKEVARGQDIPL